MRNAGWLFDTAIAIDDDVNTLQRDQSFLNQLIDIGQESLDFFGLVNDFDDDRQVF